MNPLKILIVCGVCASAALVGGCQRSDAAPGETKAPAADSAVVKVVVADVKETSYEDWGSYSADLRGIEDANLTAPFQGGRVNWIAPMGTRVKAGQPLCDIDSVKYEAALQAAMAQVEVAKGDLERARVNVEKGSLGRSVLDAANLGFQSARMNMASAQRGYEDCRCQAPFDGELVSRAIDRYQTVAPGMPTVRLSRMDKLEAVISIPETDAFSFSEGMKTEFRLLQGADRAYIGKLASIDRAIDPRSRTVTARIEIGNSSGQLKPGMVGRARILRKTYSKAIVVPATALLRLQSGVTVMVVENGIARQRKVEVVGTSEERTLISEGLKAGDKLVVSGGFQVTEGTKVSF